MCNRWNFVGVIIGWCDHDLLPAVMLSFFDGAPLSSSPLASRMHSSNAPLFSSTLSIGGGGGGALFLLVRIFFPFFFSFLGTIFCCAFDVTKVVLRSNSCDAPII